MHVYLDLFCFQLYSALVSMLLFRISSFPICSYKSHQRKKKQKEIYRHDYDQTRKKKKQKRIIHQFNMMLFHKKKN